MIFDSGSFVFAMRISHELFRFISLHNCQLVIWKLSLEPDSLNSIHRREIKISYLIRDLLLLDKCVSMETLKRTFDLFGNTMSLEEFSIMRMKSKYEMTMWSVQQIDIFLQLCEKVLCEGFNVQLPVECCSVSFLIYDNPSLFEFFKTSIINL